jgi:dTDP-4-dehydrorhamnose 3,5-epimerase
MPKGMSDYTPTPQDKIVDRIYKTPIDGLLYIDHPGVNDDRGFFAEMLLLPDLEEALGNPFAIKQINLARSAQNVCRGFHAEPWRKIICVASGTIFGAIADTRPESKTFKQVVTFFLGDGNGSLHGCFFLDKGLANSYCVFHGPTNYMYFVDQLYRDRDTGGDRAITLFDQDLNVTWPMEKNKLIISDRDRQSITLRQKYPDKFDN